MNQDIPKIRKDYLCIVNKDRADLAAVISSCLYEKGSYPLLFEFPNTVTPKGTQTDDVFSAANVSRIWGEDFSIHIKNVCATIGFWPKFILAGLSEMQLSYLDFLETQEVIRIDYPSEVEYLLAELIQGKNFLLCNEFEIDYGLYLAAHSNSILKIDTNAQSLPDFLDLKNGLVVIERSRMISTVLGVNYALSVDANIALVDSPKISQDEIEALLKLWKQERNDQYLRDLGASTFDRIENIDFTKFAFATFFTAGTPYSLLLNNIIPFTYVNINIQADFFLFNAIHHENSMVVGSALVFSPLEFGDDEEITFIERIFEKNNYYIRSLVGEEATAFELGNHIREFPFEILHICSHGGEIRGVRLALDFKDREGAAHVVEYDQILSFEASGYEEKIGVVRLWFPRRLDGLVWRSQALKEKNYPSYVFEDMNNAIQLNDKSATRRIEDGHPIISGSSAIKCKDDNYVAHFNQLAGNRCNPFVFNNTCWSWHNISSAFLAAGGLGYIGTLWSVNNNIAVRIAETFYENVFGTTILDALQIALKNADGTNDEHNYAFWGLHFSRLRIANTMSESKLTVASNLLYGTALLSQKKSETSNARALENTERQVRWYRNLLENHFIEEVATIVRDARA